MIRLLRGLGALVLKVVALPSLILEELDVLAHDPIFMLVHDMLEDKVNGLEGFIAQHADVFLSLDNRSRLLHAVLVVLFNELAIFFRVKQLLIGAFRQNFLCLSHIGGFKLAC